MGDLKSQWISAAALPLLVVVSGVMAGGCKSVNQSVPEKDIYYGRFIFERDPMVVGGIDTDLVKFTIQGEKYSIVFSSHHSRVCDTKGNAYGFGKAQVNFFPDSLLNGNCDSVHIPKGIFRSEFKGDSLYLSKYDTAADDWYRFQLKE